MSADLARIYERSHLTGPFTLRSGSLPIRDATNEVIAGA
jgi:hypothetical protein